MILELMIGRGLGICLDGKRPDASGWGYGENDANTGFEADVTIGTMKITDIDFGIDMEEFDTGTDPTEITLTTSEGVFKLPVIECLGGKDDDVVRVVLTDGQTKDIDGYISYVRAGVGPVSTKLPVEDEEDGEDEEGE